MTALSFWIPRVLLLFLHFLSPVESRCPHGYLWDGNQCRKIRCTPLRVDSAEPPHGACVFPDGRPAWDLVYQTKCTFTCRRGYNLKGSKDRVCQLDGKWSGSSTACEMVTCPALPKLAVGVYNIPECSDHAMPFDMACVQVCPLGYHISGTPYQTNTRVCLLTGTWDGQQKSCKDMQPPSITCGNGHIVVNTDPGKNTAKVTLKAEVTDNSQAAGEPGATIHVSSSHNNPGYFPIGHTAVRFQATDNTGNTAHCVVDVIVKDTEAPKFSFCPPDQNITSDQSTVRINWDSPQATDNSGIPPAVTPSFRKGEEVRVPGKYEIYYQAADQSGNRAECSFIINIKMATCTMYPPPKNGALVCYQPPAGVPLCSAVCKEGTDFVYNPAMAYICSGAKWEKWNLFLPVDSRIPWPDCSSTASSSAIKTSYFNSYFYFKGDAQDPNVQSRLKSTYILFLKTPFFPPFFCSQSQDCTEQNTKVFIGQ